MLKQNVRLASRLRDATRGLMFLVGRRVSGFALASPKRRADEPDNRAGERRPLHGVVIDHASEVKEARNKTRRECEIRDDFCQ